MKTSRLSIFNAYDYYNTIAAKKSLTKAQNDFYNFCVENHGIICDEETEDNHEIINQATLLLINI